MAQRELAPEEVERLLSSARIVRVAFHADGETYILPLGYVWFDGALHLAATAGRKTRMAAANPRVAFQVDDVATAGLLGWSSVSGEGRWERVDEPALRERVRTELFARFPELAAWAGGEYARKGDAGEMVLSRVTPLWITGRAFTAAPVG